MKTPYFERIKPVNYWDDLPRKHSYLRSAYLPTIKSYVNSDLIKVLVGQRRCGKSTLLKQLILTLIDEGIEPHNILYLSFELHELAFINSHTVLNDVIEEYFNTLSPTGRVIILLDEIQEVPSWEKAVNSFMADDRYDISFYITGSNAHLLSVELATYLTGRHAEIPIFPFSFTEYCDYHKKEFTKQSLISFIDDSGLPEMFVLPEKTQKQAYISALRDSILMNDIVKRFSIKNPKLLMLLLDFLIDNIGKLFSINSIAKKLQPSGVNVTTLTNYLHYLEAAFLIRAARRFDLKGKKILEGERKYYINDLGFNNYMRNTFDNNVTRRLENFVYLALRQAGFKVYVGNIFQLEIDFVAEKEHKTIYIQVTYLLHDEKVIEREYGNLARIKDNWPKWVVSLDDIKHPPKEGIEHIQAWELARMLDRVYP